MHVGGGGLRDPTVTRIASLGWTIEMFFMAKQDYANMCLANYAKSAANPN